MKTPEQVEGQDAVERRILVRDAILGMIRRYPQEGVFLLPTMDMLALYFQQPLMFTFWKTTRSGIEPFLSNVEDPHLLGTNSTQFSTEIPPVRPTHLGDRPLQGKQAIWLPVTLPGMSDQNAIALTVKPRNDSVVSGNKYAEALFALFSDEHFWKEFQSHLGKGVPSAPKRWSKEIESHIVRRNAALSEAARKIPRASNITDPHLPQEKDSIFDDFDATSQFLTELALAIDSFLQARMSFQPIHHPGPSNGRSFPNLHFCIAHALPTPTVRAKAFTYSARLFFTRGQEHAFASHLSESSAKAHIRKVIAEMPKSRAHLSQARRKDLLGLIRDRNAERLLTFLKPPLQANSRATADLPFTSGCVAFGYSPGDSFDRAQSEEDYTRLVTEKLLYGLCRPDDRGQYIFHIPIHVNGVSWVNIFTFTDKNPAKDTPSWRHNYLLYRDIITDLGAAIRQRSEDSYLRVIKELIWRTWATPIANQRAVLDSLNRQLFRLALVAPLPWVVFSADESPQTFAQVTPHSKFKNLRFDVKENPFFLRTLSYRLLTPETVGAKINDFATSAYHSTILEENRFVAYTAHQIKTPLREMRAAVKSIPHEAHRSDFVRSLDWMIALEDWLSSRFDRTKLPPFAEKSLSGFFAELQRSIRALKKQSVEVYGKKAPEVLVLEESNSDAPKKKWFFCETQWKAVLQTTWDNAIRYGVPGTPIEVAIAIENHCEQECVALQVRNVVNLSRPELESHIEEAQRGDTNQLGLATLGLLARRLLNNASADARHSAVTSATGQNLWQVSVPVGINNPTL